MTNQLGAGGEGLDTRPKHDPSYVEATNWIRFLRGYGPVPRNENMYDEFIRRTAQRLGVTPIEFEHPAKSEVVGIISSRRPTSVVLTGSAGDGKTHICRKVWESVALDQDAWQSKDPHLSVALPRAVDSRQITLHVIRDLSAWAPQRGFSWQPEREEVLQRFCASLVSPEPTDEVFLVAANDGQLVEAFHRLRPTYAVRQSREILETLLVDDISSVAGVPVRLLNLSRGSSADLFDRAVAAFLEHEGWGRCRALGAGPGEFFGPECPIRHNVELLATSLVQDRLHALFALCDCNRLHIPIRQILLLLVNGVVGHPGAKDGLLTAGDVPRVIRDGTSSDASLYNNLFGGNLTESRRESRLVFESFGRFGIGQETSNRVDNTLIFGDADEALQPYFDRYVNEDSFFGASPKYKAAQREYVEGADEHDVRSDAFLKLLVGQRRGLFFKVTDDDADDLKLWELTVFKFAGEYLSRVVGELAAGARVERPVVGRLVRGLNRVFTGMLMTSDREIVVATSLGMSGGRVNRLVEERVSVEPRLGEKVDVVLVNHVPVLRVTLGPNLSCSLPLHLTRYEFLSRVAEGVLPSSFSRECYEDVAAFKALLLARLVERRAASGEERAVLALQLLEVDEAGKAVVVDLEVRNV